MADVDFNVARGVALPAEPQQREAIIRAAVAAMPNCNPGVADDLIEGHAIHMEADDLVAVWHAARGAGPRCTCGPQDACSRCADEQMRSYGEQCALIERERCAKVCEELEVTSGHAGLEYQACAQAIRAGSIPAKSPQKPRVSEGS
jgi:hypothetical protein